ncbi:MAG: mannitol dehydrogenase family protein [Treponema sp.]|jgi:fructuronate reductase|nr:mannitol dehydrogenase family protein [Treponema sp.]
MLELTRTCLKEKKSDFERAGIAVPSFDIEEVRRRTRESPVWIHFGSGNLFRAYHAALSQRLLESGCAAAGIIAAEPFDYEIIERVYRPHDNLSLRVVMKANGELEKQITAGIAEALAADSADEASWGRLKEIFRAPSLQVASLSITEKGHDLRTLDGGFRPDILEEFKAGPGAPVHAMTKLCALCWERCQAGGRPIALLSTDNFSHNGDRLKEAILATAEEWRIRGHVDRGFTDWLSNPAAVSFPLSMIDKITPYPSERVQEQLETAVRGMGIIKTAKNSVTAPFVNTEEAEYLVIEDSFPNGRPPLEKAGVYFTDRDTVDLVERMKVCTCLNPLHTALAIFGCLLGFKSIAAEMGDPDLAALARKIGCDEGMPVVADPRIISPAGFIDEVLTKRLPNAHIPDTPQRIAADTSQKLGIRFGETIKLYTAREDLDIRNLTLIPLVIAAWCRYLLCLDDEGNPFNPSPDPLLPGLQAELAGVKLGDPGTGAGKLKNILSSSKIFAVDLYEAGLGERVEAFFAELLEGKGAVRKTLHRCAGQPSSPSPKNG